MQGTSPCQRRVQSRNDRCRSPDSRPLPENWPSQAAVNLKLRFSVLSSWIRRRSGPLRRRAQLWSGVFAPADSPWAEPLCASPEAGRGSLAGGRRFRRVRRRFAARRSREARRRARRSFLPSRRPRRGAPASPVARAGRRWRPAGGRARGEAGGRALGHAHVDVGGAGRARIGEHARQREPLRVRARGVAEVDEQAVAHRDRQPARAGVHACDDLRERGRAPPRARPARPSSAPVADARSRRGRPTAPVTVGSALESSAGPSTTPSAATAVRAPPASSAATGGCSMTWMRSPCGKLAVGVHFAHDAKRRDRGAQRAGCRTSSVLMCRAAPASAASIARRFGTVHAADLHVLHRHERGVAQPQPAAGQQRQRDQRASSAMRRRRWRASTRSQRRASAERRARSAHAPSGARARRRRASAPRHAVPRGTSRGRDRGRRAPRRLRPRADAEKGERGASEAGRTRRPAGARAIHRASLRPRRANPYARESARRRASAPRARARTPKRSSTRRRPSAITREHVGGAWPRRCSR